MGFLQVCIECLLYSKNYRRPWGFSNLQSCPHGALIPSRVRKSPRELLGEGEEERVPSVWPELELQPAWGCSRTQAARACVGHRDSLAGISTEREQEEEERTLGLVSFPTPHHIAMPDPLPPHTQPQQAGGLVPGGHAPG